MLLRTLVLLCAAVHLVRGQCGDTQASVGVFYSCELSIDSFFIEAGVSISAKQSGFAGLPQWLTVSQQNESSPAYIHGTPTHQADITLEVRGVNVGTLDSRILTIEIAVTSSPGSILQEDEFYITNFDLVEFLSPSVQMLLLNALRSAYQLPLPGSPEIVRVTHPSVLGIPVPRPPLKHGVVVTTTPGIDNVRPGSANQNCPTSFTQELAANTLEIEYCMTSVNSISLTTTPPTLANDRSLPPTAGSSITLIIVIVVTVLLVFMIVTGMTCVFCGNRQQGYTVPQSKKRKRSTMQNSSRATNKGPVSAQNCLRELAQPRVPAGSQEQGQLRVSSGEEFLEFQDLTDYGNDESTSSRSSREDPPPYVHPNISYIRTQ